MAPNFRAITIEEAESPFRPSKCLFRLVAFENPFMFEPQRFTTLKIPQIRTSGCLHTCGSDSVKVLPLDGLKEALQSDNGKWITH